MTKQETFRAAYERYMEKQNATHGYNENCGNHQDDLNEMICEDWTFTKGFEKVWSAYTAYYEHGTIPAGLKRKAAEGKKALEKALEAKMDKAVVDEFNRYCS